MLPFVSTARAITLAGAVIFVAVSAGCSSSSDKSSAMSDSARAADSATKAAARAAPAVISAISGFKAPESVRYDPTADVYFISNINGNPGEHDNNGFISRMKADGAVDSLHFILAGRGGVTLNAPKGIILVADTLWVTDIDQVRAFNKKTGALVTNVDLKPLKAVFLNDLAQGPDGAIYITDTGVRMDAKGGSTHPGPDRIFRIAPDHKVTVAAHGDTLAQPNGIVWDSAAARFIVGGGSKNVFAWKPGDKAPTVIASGPGGYDGLDILPDGRILISSWADSSVSVIAGNTMTRLITGVSGPADFGIDTRRRRVAIPRLMNDRVELWAIPAR